MEVNPKMAEYLVKMMMVPGCGNCGSCLFRGNTMDETGRYKCILWELSDRLEEHHKELYEQLRKKNQADMAVSK